MKIVILCVPRGHDVHPATPILATAIVLFTVRCTSDVSTPSAAHRAAEVLVTEVVQRDVPIYAEWMGTTDGTINAVIKTSVSCYL